MTGILFLFLCQLGDLGLNIEDLNLAGAPESDARVQEAVRAIDDGTIDEA